MAPIHIYARQANFIRTPLNENLRSFLIDRVDLKTGKLNRILDLTNLVFASSGKLGWGKGWLFRADVIYRRPVLWK